MNFEFFTRNTESVELECGKQICGLQKQGRRPYRVSLNREEIIYLLENPKYLRTISYALEG